MRPYIYFLTGPYLVLALFGLVVTSSYAQEILYPARPEGGAFVQDQARLLTSSSISKIDGVGLALLKDRSIPIIVVTIESLSRQGAGILTIEEYARRLFDQWGIGLEQHNYGMLLLVSVGDRKARIELGAAWEHSADSMAQDVMDRLIIPEFKHGDMNRGILNGVDGLDRIARGLSIPLSKQDWIKLSGLILLVVVGVGVAISLIKNGQKGPGWALLAAIGAILFFLLSRSGKSGGGGGGRFGGGSSGGGGASGSW